MLVRLGASKGEGAAHDRCNTSQLRGNLQQGSPQWQDVVNLLPLGGATALLMA